MSVETNKALRQQWADRLAAKDIDGAMELLSTDFVSHIPGAVWHKEDTRRFFEMQIAAFPDHNAITLQVIADDEYISHYMRSEGTHEGQFLFLQPSGKYLTWEFIDIFRVKDGQFVEHWVESDTFGMLMQLGMVPGVQG